MKSIDPHRPHLPPAARFAGGTQLAVAQCGQMMMLESVVVISLSGSDGSGRISRLRSIMAPAETRCGHRGSHRSTGEEPGMETQQLHRGPLIDHIQLVMKDLPASRRFYEGVFAVLGVSIGTR